MAEQQKIKAKINKDGVVEVKALATHENVRIIKKAERAKKE